MERKNLLVGIAALLVFGAVLVSSIGVHEDGQPCTGEGRGLGEGKRFGQMGNVSGDEARAAMFEDLGLDEDATQEEIRDAMFQHRLEELGLTEDSTIAEFRAAMQEQRLSRMRDRLGLSEDATEEEIKNALGEKAFNRHRVGGGFSRGMGGASIGPSFLFL